MIHVAVMSSIEYSFVTHRPLTETTEPTKTKVFTKTSGVKYS